MNNQDATLYEQQELEKMRKAAEAQALQMFPDGGEIETLERPDQINQETGWLLVEIRELGVFVSQKDHSNMFRVRFIVLESQFEEDEKFIGREYSNVWNAPGKLGYGKKETATIITSCLNYEKTSTEYKQLMNSPSEMRKALIENSMQGLTLALQYGLTEKNGKQYYNRTWRRPVFFDKVRQHRDSVAAV